MKYLKYPIEKALNPNDDNDAVYCLKKDHYWAVENECLILSCHSPYQSPLCNSNESIANKIAEIGGFKVQFFEKVFLPLHSYEYEILCEGEVFEK